MFALHFALRHPLTIMVMVTAIALGSLFSIDRMRTDVFPDLNQSVIYVAQPYGGMDPAQMEGLITNYYEYAFLFMNGIDHVESKNVQNIALVKLYFHPGTNMAQAVAESAIYANRAAAFFPPGTVTPFIMCLDASMVPVAYVTLSSETRSIDELADLMLFKVRPILASLPGTTAPQPFGGSLRSIVCNLDPERLRAYDLSPAKAAAALNTGNIITPSGNGRIRDKMPFVSINSIVVDPQRLGDIEIIPEKHIYMRDLLVGGKVQDTTDIPTGWALVNGRRAVYMPILKTSDASTLAVASQLKDHLDYMRSQLPKDCVLRLEFDQSPYVTGAVGGVVQESAIGAVLTGLMVLLFLHDWRSVVIVLITIPLSLMGALIGLFITGQSINLMTLGGLSLAVGILVDEGTVVIENIHTQMTRTPSLARAVFVGNAETAVPRLLVMLSILAVFIPAFLMEGAAQRLFVPLSLAVGFAMITSYTLSSVLVPVLAVWLLRSHPEGHGHEEEDEANEGWLNFNRFKRNYVKVVRVVLARRWLVLASYGLIAGAVLVVCGSQVGREISPQVDAGSFQMRLKAPVGTRLEVTEDLTRETLEQMKNILGQDSMTITVSHIGQTAPTLTANAVFLWTSGPDQAVIRVSLNEEKRFRTEEVKERLRNELPAKIKPWLAGRLMQEGVPHALAERRADTVAIAFEPADVINQVMSFGSPTPIEVVTSGPNQDDNRAYAAKVEAELRKIPTLRDLQYGQAFYPRVNIELDRERCGYAGMTVADAANAMIAATSSSRYIVPVYWADPKTGIGYQVQLQVPPAQVSSMDEIADIPIRHLDNGEMVKMGDVAKITESMMPQEYDRINQRRMVTLTANVVGEDLGRAINRINQAIKKAGDPPRGATIELRGQVPPMNQMFAGLATGLGLSVVVVFLMLTAYFQSVKLALVSVATTPAVVAGVAFALFITHTTLNIQSFMGAIMAIGVAVANAILLVTWAEKARQTGIGAMDGARTGAEERLRPILMTSCAMIAGMIPMALGLGEGGEQSAPLGRAVIGGLGVATGATLLILPSVFTVVMGRTRVGSASLHPDDEESSYYSPETGEGALLALADEHSLADAEPATEEPGRAVWLPEGSQEAGERPSSEEHRTPPPSDNPQSPTDEGEETP